MNRPTRVPASTVVRMNNASNMIAKWYQKAARRPPPNAPERMLDMPTASVGAPPVRATSVDSPTARAADSRASGVMVKPRLVTADAADAAVLPTTPPGAFMA